MTEISRPDDPMRPTSGKMDVWTLFFSQFKIGDEVVIIDEDDQITVGKFIGYTEDSCIIKDQFDTIIPWVNIRFMSHDGFPCKKLMGADGSRLIEKIDTLGTKEAIRTALTCSVGASGSLKETNLLDQAVFGDPFLIEGVKAKLYNAGNDSPYYWSNGPGYLWEEIVCLEAKDGAQAQLFGLNTIYHFSHG